MTENSSITLKDIDNYLNSQVSYYPPGAVLSYKLPEVDTGELFDPISCCAIRESAQFGPLTEKNLKRLLRHKLDKPENSIVEVIRQYTKDLKDLNIQLFNLESRINQIVTIENHRTDFLERRIRYIDNAVVQRKLPDCIQNQLHLSNAAKKALQHVESQGPLDGNDLMDFIHIGMCAEPIPMNDLMKQLNNFYLRITEEVYNEKNVYKISYENVLNALKDILREIMTM